MGGWKEEPRRSEGRRRKRKQHESQNQEARHTDHSIPLGKARHERGTAQTKLIEQKSASRTVQSVVGKSNTAAPDTVVIATLMYYKRVGCAVVLGPHPPPVSVQSHLVDGGGPAG